MAYNNVFPTTYQPMYYNPPTPQPTQNNPSSLIWVTGEAGAKSYLVAPNSTVTLWDSEAQTIYLKSADASGMPSMKVLDYTIRDSGQATAPAVVDDTRYVTYEEFEKFEKEVKSQLKGRRPERRKEGDNE